MVSLRARVPLATGRNPVMFPRLAALQATVRHPSMGLSQGVFRATSRNLARLRVMVLSPAWGQGEGCLPTQEV